MGIQCCGSEMSAFAFTKCKTRKDRRKSESQIRVFLTRCPSQIWHQDGMSLMLLTEIALSFYPGGCWETHRSTANSNAGLLKWSWPKGICSVQRAKCHLHGISWLERPYHCPKAGVLKLWMYFLSQCKTLSPLKEKKTLTNTAWSLLQSTKEMFGCLFLFAQLSQHGVGIHCRFLAFLERGKKMGLVQDASILWIQTKELRAVLAATPTSDYVLFYKQ